MENKEVAELKVVKTVDTKDLLTKEEKKVKTKPALDENVLQARINRLNDLKKFALSPEIELSKKEVKVLRAIGVDKFCINYLELIREVDMKPSKLDKIIEKLTKLKMITNNDGVLTVQELGNTICNYTNEQEKKNKKFKDFVNILSDKEFDEFCEICSNLQSEIK